MIFKFDDSQTLQQFNQYNRKDSGSSEVAAFLNPSGRTSRISSVGSQGSAVSRLSCASGISRSPSPHKMLVETSFCGPKIAEPTSDACSIEHLTADIERVILTRRGDPTKVLLAEGVEVKEMPSKSVKITKENIQNGSNMMPAEAARSSAKEARRKEIEALKVRLNAINQRQLEQKQKCTGTMKKVIGVTQEGTQYIRIKLKPDHLYEDNGVSPNERIIEENDFSETIEKKSEKPKKDEVQMSFKSSSDNAPDNRPPSPASTSVSRKSSFCSFFKSKDATADAVSKSKSPVGASGKSKFNNKSPLPSPSKSSFSSRLALSLFKTNRNTFPSQIEMFAQEETINKNAALLQHQSAHPPSNVKDKPKLRYYDAPDNQMIIHIPLHTPPEEKEFSVLKKMKEENNVKKEEESNEKKEVTTLFTATTIHHEPKVILSSSSSSTIILLSSSKPKKAPTAQIEKMQSTDELELDTIPHRKMSEAESSLWSVEAQRHSSQESQETVISSQPKKENLSKNGFNEKPAIPTYIDTTNENQTITQQRARHKKHILFSTKLGSGSEEQIFSTQLSLSKTESQSSQLSQASVFESPKNEECGTKVPEVTQINNLKHQSSSEVEKVTAICARSRSDQNDSGSKFHSATRKQQSSSGEFSAKKRESSEELLHKTTLRETKKENQSVQEQQHLSLSSNEQNQIDINALQRRSSGSRMEISSESDRESDFDACIHKRVSRLMEDHESTGLVLQESFDDELPYIPTTLPEERSSGIKIIPTRERTQSELITIPVERPRSTTPINPTSLDNFCEKKTVEYHETALVRGEKLRISLPRQKADQSIENIQHKQVTRRISNLSNKTWTEFAEQGLHNTASAIKKNEKSLKPSNSSQDDDPVGLQQQSQQHHQQQLVKSHSKKSLTSKWIDFENIPEKRQPPKKITTIPLNRDMPSEKIHSSKHSHHHHHRQYVSPEECQCECHETKKESNIAEASGKTHSDDSQPLLDENAERNSTMR
jgi:hypothetical protein